MLFRSLIVDGIEKIDRVLKKFKNGKYQKYRLLDVLTCDGGCIGGPGMSGRYPLKERKRRILDYKEYARRYEKDLGRTGTKIHAEDIDFRRKF